MKVLHLSKFYPPVLGGIESTTWELTEGLNRAGLRTDVLCSNQRPVTARERFPGGYDVVRAGSLGRLLSTSVAPAMLRELRRMAADRDVIHVHMPDPMAAIAVWSVRPKATVVVHWHSDVIRQRMGLKVYEPLQRWLLMRADAVVATSQAYADASQPLLRWRSKVSVIPIGISDNRGLDCSLKAEALRRRYGHRRIVFALGRMTYYKGFDVLIAAAAALPEGSVVVIGGEGELLERYTEMVRNRGLADRVDFPGHINDDDLPSYFEACDVFCMPSIARAEAYGVAMLEAMVMGKPIVATNITGSGVPWVNVHGQTGFNVPVGESQPLAAAITRLLQDEPLRARLGSAARQRYLDGFGADRMTRQIIDLYQRLAA